MLITRISIKNPVFATMVMVGITVLGIFSYARLRVEQMPDVSLPFVQIMTLYPGDLIATGTPAGVSRLQPGDVVEIEVQGVGVLRNYVRDSKAISRA